MSIHHLKSHPLYRLGHTVARAGDMEAIRQTARRLANDPVFCRAVCPGSDAVRMREEMALPLLVGGLARLWMSFGHGLQVLTPTQAAELSGLPERAWRLATVAGLVKWGADGAIDFTPLLSLPWAETKGEMRARLTKTGQATKRRMQKLGLRNKPKKPRSEAGLAYDERRRKVRDSDTAAPGPPNQGG